MIKRIFILLIPFILFGCGTTDRDLQQQGRSDSYIQGFHDGRHSGLYEGGNDFESYVKDNARYDSDEDYRRGWLAGEKEGKSLQSQNDSISKGILSSPPPKGKSDDFDQVARDAVKGVDTSGLENLK